MAVRQRDGLAKHPTKGYYRDIGPRGAYHRFYLGHDDEKARRILDRLGEVWSGVERWCKEFGGDGWHKIDLNRGDVSRKPAWDKTTLAIAKAVQRAETTVGIPVSLLPRVCGEYIDLGWKEETVINGHPDYDRLLNLQRCFPMVKIVPVAGPGPQDNLLVQKVAAIVAEAPIRTETVAADLVAEAQELRRRHGGGGANAAIADATLHAAMTAYRKDEASRPNLPQDSRDTAGRQIDLLLEHHKDLPLSELNAKAMRAMEEYWGGRPNGKRGKLARKTCRNQIKRLRHFWRWLNEDDRLFGWTKPAKYEVRPVRIEPTPEELAKKLTSMQVDVWTTDELTKLWKEATPKERTWIALSLNCGAGMAELARLQLAEVHLRTPHGFYPELGGSSRSWVKRLRFKVEVYGEWLLWDMTVAAIEWLRTRRPVTEATTLIVTELGQPLKSGKKWRSYFENAWAAVVRRVQKKHPKFRHLPFNSLKRTGKDLVRQVADGEVAGYHICHGTPVKTDRLADLYSNRDFRKLHAALEEIRRERLAEVFKSIPNSFPTDYSGRGARWTPPAK